MHIARLNRREVMALVGGAAAAWPARGTIFSARTFLPSTSGTQPVSSNISEASSTSSAISALVVSLIANNAKEAYCGAVCGGERSGVGGAKGGGRGECAPAQHVLGSEPGSRVTRAGAYTARRAVIHPRQEPCAGKPHARIWAGGVR